MRTNHAEQGASADEPANTPSHGATSFEAGSPLSFIVRPFSSHDSTLNPTSPILTPEDYNKLDHALGEAMKLIPVEKIQEHLPDLRLHIRIQQIRMKVVKLRNEALHRARRKPGRE